MPVGNELNKEAKIEQVFREACVYSLGLFDLYNKPILRELQIVTRFIIGGHDFNDIRYADNSVLNGERLQSIQAESSKIN